MSDEVQICQIFPHYAPVLAGAAERFRRYAPGLHARGVKTSVITSRSDPSLPLEETLEGLVSVSRMEVGLDARARDQRLFRAAAAHLQRQGMAGAQVVQTIKIDRRLFRSLLSIKRQGRALMFVSTMVEPETWGRTALHRWANLQLQILSQRLFDAVVVGSPVMAAAQRRMGVGECRLHIISHGVDTHRFQPAEPDQPLPALVEKVLPAGAKVCLYVGHLIPRKGVLTLLEAWPEVAMRHPDAWLVLVGALQRPTISSERERQEIETYQNALFKKLNSLPQVLHVPEQKDIHRWYQMADMFIFPSTQEGFPNALLEAMSTGLPCLTRRFMGFPEGQLGERQGVIQVVGAEPPSWSQAISALLHDEPTRRRMGCAARELIVRDHALQKTLDEYASLYHLLSRLGDVA
ncbi:glycosyltransferase family 4 protein [Prosthecobacter vanneervenii]|uniref:Glycosyltransferase involved in cell wall biosynthesis n=1 Tax=Prosthecobacter vanneervenii TaxID=48466 RepID=A0A7W7Y6H9_9BACT|nr:glycosyltransferase family 4 protein [Prosthecobacter vanneervenii]MBB5030489.1 glycosyltransferase involved in cell wall biosynthesis [Prosthecobacter vanneervenii]